MKCMLTNADPSSLSNSAKCENEATMKASIPYGRGKFFHLYACETCGRKYNEFAPENLKWKNNL